MPLDLRRTVQTRPLVIFTLLKNRPSQALHQRIAQNDGTKPLREEDKCFLGSFSLQPLENNLRWEIR